MSDPKAADPFPALAVIAQHGHLSKPVGKSANVAANPSSSTPSQTTHPGPNSQPTQSAQNAQNSQMTHMGKMPQMPQMTQIPQVMHMPQMAQMPQMPQMPQVTQMGQPTSQFMMPWTYGHSSGMGQSVFMGPNGQMYAITAPANSSGAPVNYAEQVEDLRNMLRLCAEAVMLSEQRASKADSEVEKLKDIVFRLQGTVDELQSTVKHQESDRKRQQGQQADKVGSQLQVEKLAVQVKNLEQALETERGLSRQQLTAMASKISNIEHSVAQVRSETMERISKLIDPSVNHKDEFKDDSGVLIESALERLDHVESAQQKDRDFKLGIQQQATELVKRVANFEKSMETIRSELGSLNVSFQSVASAVKSNKSKQAKTSQASVPNLGELEVRVAAECQRTMMQHLDKRTKEIEEKQREILQQNANEVLDAILVCLATNFSTQTVMMSHVLSLVMIALCVVIKGSENPLTTKDDMPQFMKVFKVVFEKNTVGTSQSEIELSHYILEYFMTHNDMKGHMSKEAVRLLEKSGLGKRLVASGVRSAASPTMLANLVSHKCKTPKTCGHAIMMQLAGLFDELFFPEDEEEFKKTSEKIRMHKMLDEFKSRKGDDVSSEEPCVDPLSS